MGVIVEIASIIEIISKRIFSPTLKRNEWMVENCDLLVAYVKYSWGGARKTLDYAIRKKKPYINFAEHKSG